MTPSRPKKSNREVERRYFEEFRQTYNFPSGLIEHADNAVVDVFLLSLSVPFDYLTPQATGLACFSCGR